MSREALAPHRPAERGARRDRRRGLCRALRGARALNATGIDCIVLDANEPGFGASTRNGGMVSGGVNVGKRYLAKADAARRSGTLPQRCRRSLHAISKT